MVLRMNTLDILFTLSVTMNFMTLNLNYLKVAKQLARWVELFGQPIFRYHVPETFEVNPPPP